MLSAVIQSRHSYGAVHLAVQPPDQRSVHFGPLVVHSPVSRSTDYIFTRSIERWTRVAASYPYEQSVSRTDSSTHGSSTECLVVTGSLWTSLRTRRANPRCRVENMLTASGLQSPES